MKLCRLFCFFIFASTFSCFGQVPPGIVTQPMDKTGIQGSSVMFSVSATGTTPLSYQWSFNSAEIVGATKSAYTRTNVQSADAGGYFVVITNSYGSITSSVATLTVQVPPTITAQLDSETNVVGDTIILDVAASGTDNPSCPLTYQWRKNNNPTFIAGATDSFLFFDSVQASDAGSYTVRVQNCAGSTTSSVAVLTVYVPPTIVVQPQTQTRLLGSNVTFMVRITITNSVTPPVTYQWYQDGEALTNDSRISGVTSTNLTILNVSPNDEGDYVAVISNPATDLIGNDERNISLNATLTVVIPPTINFVTVDDERIVQGANAIFTVDADGSDDLIYQWRKNGLQIPGETDFVLQVVNALPGDEADYTVVVQSTAVNAASPVAIKAISSPLHLTVLVPPTITIQPQSKSVPARQNATFTVYASGTAPLSYQWHFNSADIPGATNSVYSFLATNTLQNGAYSVTVGNEADTVDSDEATLIVVAETERPTITLSSPADGSRNSNAILVVHGTAADNARVDAVYWTLDQTMNDVNQQPAIGTTNWTVTIPLTRPGTNIFRVRSLDSSGNYSATTLARRFVYVRSDRLTLITNGIGRVTPNSGGQLLEIGKPYTLTGKPGAGQVFASWTGGVISTNPAVTFTMQSNLVLQVNFIPNPFIPRKGTYSGLFYRTNGVEHQSSGFFTLKLADKGAFSCKVQLAGAKYASKGFFSLQGTASVTITRPGLSPLQLSFAMDLTNQTDQVLGTVSDGTWVAALSGDRAIFNATLNPAPQTGRYTMYIPGNPDSVASPGGDGFGTVMVDDAGKISLRGTLGDGTKISQKTLLSKTGQWPFYNSIYRGSGSVLSWVTFTNSGIKEFSGDMSWIKQANLLAKFYAAGFSNGTSIAGSFYTPPLPGYRVLNFEVATVLFSGGNLSQSFSNNISLGADNKVTNLSSNKFSLTIALPTGLFKGKVTDPDSGNTISFKGAASQKGNAGFGFFLGTNQSGRVYFGE